MRAIQRGEGRICWRRCRRAQNLPCRGAGSSPSLGGLCGPRRPNLRAGVAFRRLTIKSRTGSGSAPKTVEMKAALVVSVLSACALAPCAGQAVASTINRFPSTYVNGLATYQLGGFSYAPLASATSALYHSARAVLPSTAVLHSGTAVLGASSGLTATALPAQATTVSNVHQPVYQVNTVTAAHQVQLVHAAAPAATHIVAHTPTVYRPAALTHAVLQPAPTVAAAAPVVTQHSHPQVLHFRPEVRDEIRLVEREEPPRIEQVAIKDPKVAVIDIAKPGQPGMKVFQVTRTASPPTTIEFVNDGPRETQVTVFNEDGTTQHGVRALVQSAAEVKAVHAQTVPAHVPVVRLQQTPKQLVGRLGSSSAVLH